MFRQFLLLIVANLAISQSARNLDSVTLTIYDNGNALIRDCRNINFWQGNTQIYFPDVASTIRLDTLDFSPNGQSQNIKLIEQDFASNSNLNNSALKFFVGNPLQLDVWTGNSLKTVSGKLLSFSNGIALENSPGTVSMYNDIMRIRIPNIATNILTTPTLKFIASSPRTMTCLTDITYKASGINWHVNYRLTLNNINSNGNHFSGWLGIDNKSGKRYSNASVKLVAGVPQTSFLISRSSQHPSGPQAVVKPPPNYRTFNMNRPITINNSSGAQYELFPKAYSAYIILYYVASIPIGDFEGNITFLPEFRIPNTKQDRLGFSLPAGNITIYIKNSKNQSQIVAQGRTKHTKPGDTLTVRGGPTRDVIGNVTVLRKEIDPKTRKTKTLRRMLVTNYGSGTIYITLRNLKKKNVSIVYDPVIFTVPMMNHWGGLKGNYYDTTLSLMRNQTRDFEWTQVQR